MTIDIGSKIEPKESSNLVVESVDVEGGVIRYTNQGFDYFQTYTVIEDLTHDFISINGVPVGEIGEVRISGYNDTVTLKIGDEFIFAGADMDLNIGEYPPDVVINRITDGEVYASDGTRYHLNLDSNDYWYVNGKLHHRDDIIIPDQSVQANEEITRDNFHEVLLHNSYSVFSKDSEGGVTYKNDNRYIYIKELSNKDSHKYAGSIGGFFEITTYSWDDVLNIIIPKFNLKPIPKPRNLIEWWQKNKVEGFIILEDSGYYTFETHDNHDLATILKDWDLQRQIETLKKLIEIYR